MRLTTLQALDLCLQRLALKARFEKNDKLRAYYNTQAVAVQSAVVDECNRIHARGGVVPASLAACPC